MGGCSAVGESGAAGKHLTIAHPAALGTRTAKPTLTQPLLDVSGVHTYGDHRCLRALPHGPIGWRFRRVGAVEAALLANLRWLAGYRHPRHAGLVDRGRVREVFGAGLPLLEGARQLGDPVRVLPGVYHGLRRGHLLAADVERATLSLVTRVTTAGSVPGPAAMQGLVRWSR